MKSEFGEKRPDAGEQATSVYLYKDLLLRATLNAHNRAIEDHVTAIDFSGPFAEIADKLDKLTQSDPQKREHGAIAYVTPNRKVLIRNAIEQGNEAFVAIYVEVKPRLARLFLPKKHKQDRFVGTMIHSHPFDSHPSPLDLSHLLLSGKDPLALTSTLIVTPTKRVLIFRGLQTPQLSQKEVKAKINLWEKQIEERVARFKTPDMTDSQVNDLGVRAQNAILKQIIQKYGLKYFSNPAGQTIAHLTSQGTL